MLRQLSSADVCTGARYHSISTRFKLLPYVTTASRSAPRTNTSLLPASAPGLPPAASPGTRVGGRRRAEVHPWTALVSPLKQYHSTASISMPSTRQQPLLSQKHATRPQLHRTMMFVRLRATCSAAVSLGPGLDVVLATAKTSQLSMPQIKKVQPSDPSVVADGADTTKAGHSLDWFSRGLCRPG